MTARWVIPKKPAGETGFFRPAKRGRKNLETSPSWFGISRRLFPGAFAVYKRQTHRFLSRKPLAGRLIVHSCHFPLKPENHNP